jgi:tetratricopeptide (TPR) repeat protein
MGYGQLRSGALVAAGRFDDAVAAATAEAAANPGDPEPCFNRGQALAALERFAEAAADYERALAMDPGASAVDPEAVDDELFFALRSEATRRGDPAPLRRYLELLPAGRHAADVPKWTDKLAGIEQVWVREKV